MAVRWSTWTGEDLRAWRARVVPGGVSQDVAADELGYDRRQYGRMERDENKIPLYTELACTALEIGPLSILRRRSREE